MNAISSSTGRVTMPTSARNTVDVCAEDKGPPTPRDDRNASPLDQSMAAMRLAINAFDGAAIEAGIACEEEIVSLVRETRARMWAERCANAPCTRQLD